MIETIKKYLNYAGLAIAAILGIIVMVLSGKNNRLKADNANLEGKLAVGKDLNELEKQKEKADDAVGDYNSVRDAYLKSNGDNGGKP